MVASLDIRRSRPGTKPIMFKLCDRTYSLYSLDDLRRPPLSAVPVSLQQVLSDYAL